MSFLPCLTITITGRLNNTQEIYAIVLLLCATYNNFDRSRAGCLYLWQHLILSALGQHLVLYKVFRSPGIRI